MATPAEPLLASNIYLSQKNKESEEHHPAKRRKISSGATSIDNTLDGGFDIGSITCITSEPDHGANDLVHGLLVAHLLSSLKATATVIDSSHSFDLRRLFRAIEASLRGDREAAIKVLDRLKIMKVFDYVGVSEALVELQEESEARAISSSSDPTNKAVPKATIPDSQDDEDEEVLDSPSPEKKAPEDDDGDTEAPNLLIIDSISQLIAPLIKNNYTQGQALLSSLMRSLGHLTRSQDLCTVVLSTALSNRPSPGEGILSLFRSCTIRPLLGSGLGYLVDVHLYLHRLPRRFAGSHDAESGHQSKLGRMVSVLEVVQDRHGGRFGRWSPFEYGEDGRLMNMS